jgi:type II secretory pathway predicted ATPase ExeA
MILKFYNLREQPFGVTPDPRYLYLSSTHREALATLTYGITSGRGFLTLIAPPGMGKTTLLFHLLQQFGKTVRTVFIFQTHVTPRDFLRNLMKDLGVDDSGEDLVSMQAKLNELLLAEAKAGRRVVVVVDEAQNLEDSVFEHLRMLSNFETASEKLMQIVLAGQPQLADRLLSPTLVQLRQRISMVGRLLPFDREETEHYICRRLEIAGYAGQMPLFTRQALRCIAEASGGIPRNINNICFNALSLGCVNQQRMIPADTIQEVVRDLDLTTIKRLPVTSVTTPTRPLLSHGAQATIGSRGRIRGWVGRIAAAACICLSLVLGYATFGGNKRTPPPEANQIPRPSSAAALPEPVAAVPGITVPQQTSSIASEGTVAGASETEPVASAAAEPTVNSSIASLPTKSIRVRKNQTLRSISKENLGAYTPYNLNAIQELNPWLTNPDHIRAGQTIRIPETNGQQNLKDTPATKPVAEAGKL